MRGSQTELLDTFLKLGFLSHEALKHLKASGTRKGIPAVEAALVSGILHPDAKGWVLANALGIPFLEVDAEAVPLSFSEILPEAIARETMVVPVSREEGRLTLAVVDPFQNDSFSRIEEVTGLRVTLVVCPARTVTRVLERFYPDALSLPPGEAVAGAIGREEAQEWIARGRGRRLAENVLLRAAKAGIGAVRIYPSGRFVAVYGDSGRGTSLLLSLPLRFRGALIDAFAGLAGIPAGRASVEESVFQLETAGAIRAFRITVLRGLSGEEAVVKVLPDLKSVIALDSIGFHPDQTEVTRRLLSPGEGLCVVSSPEDGGVGTTIFALLREAHRPGRRVVTVEEAHRFRNDGYIQLERREVEKRLGRKWERLADSLEPDALAIERVSGREELLDLIHIARRGIPVFCGIKGVDIRRTLATLFSLDVDPFLLARVVRLVMHQRLVNVLCSDCRRAVPAVPPLRLAGERYRVRLETLGREASFYVPGGCPRCRGSGYTGKVALFDLLPFTPGVQTQVTAGTSPEERTERILGEHLQSPFPAVEDLLRRGMVTFDDVLPFFR